MKHYAHAHARSPTLGRLGFTLIELSIVLVIIGLVVGGVLVGKELIFQGQLRKLRSDLEAYEAAVLTFKLKYAGLPGDLSNATTFWEQDTGCPMPGSIHIECSQGFRTGTCNGNGDGRIGIGVSPGFQESYRFWQQLQLASFVKGGYSGLSCQGGYPVDYPTFNVPPNPVTNTRGGIRSYHFDTTGESHAVLNGKHILGLGPNTASWWPTGAGFPSLYAMLFDLKFDDGRPNSGKLISQDHYPGSCLDTQNYKKEETTDGFYSGCRVEQVVSY